MLTPKRITTDELLDEHDAPRADMERSLRDLRRINKYLGGIRVYRSLVRVFEPRSILDVGTGTSDLLESVNVPLRVGLDFKIEHLLYVIPSEVEGPGERRPSPTPRSLDCARDDIHRVVGDANHLPFRDGAIDLVTSSHFFHHFSPDENASILRESLRVSRKGVAVTDTRRHYAPLLFVQLLCALRVFGRITRFDAPASVRQGYTLSEAREIVGRVKAARSRVVRKTPYRFGILLWKT